MAELGRRLGLLAYRRSDSRLGMIDRGPVLPGGGPPGRYPKRAIRLEDEIIYKDKTLKIVLSPDVFEISDERSIYQRDLLISLSERDDFKVVVLGGTEFDPAWRNVGQVTIDAEPTNGRLGVVTRWKSGRSMTSVVQSAAVRVYQGMRERPASRTSFESVVLAMAVSDGEVLYVTEDPNLLAMRGEVKSPFGLLMGVVTIREAVALGFAVQRARGIYSVDRPRWHEEREETSYYLGLSRAYLPLTLSAYRSALRPDNPNQSQDLVAHLESLISKFEALLLGLDECGRIHLAEGQYGGGNSRLTRYLGVTHSSVVLFAGILDVVAHLVNTVAELNASPIKISWRNLVIKKAPYKNLKGLANRIQRAAVKLSNDEIEFLVEARHLYAHKSSLPGGVGTFQNSDGSETHATYCLLYLGEVADERGVNLPDSLLGTFRDGNVQPMFLHERLVYIARNVIEHVSACLCHDDDMWWSTEGEKEDLESEDALTDEHVNRRPPMIVDLWT